MRGHIEALEVAKGLNLLMYRSTIYQRELLSHSTPSTLICFECESKISGPGGAQIFNIRHDKRQSLSSVSSISMRSSLALDALRLQSFRWLRFNPIGWWYPIGDFPSTA